MVGNYRKASNKSTAACSSGSNCSFRQNGRKPRSQNYHRQIKSQSLLRNKNRRNTINKNNVPIWKHHHLTGTEIGTHRANIRWCRCSCGYAGSNLHARARKRVQVDKSDGATQIVRFNHITTSRRGFNLHTGRGYTCIQIVINADLRMSNDIGHHYTCAFDDIKISVNNCMVEHGRSAYSQVPPIGN